MKKRQIGPSPQKNRGICQEIFGVDRSRVIPLLEFNFVVQEVLMGTHGSIDKFKGLSNYLIVAFDAQSSEWS